MWTAETSDGATGRLMNRRHFLGRTAVATAAMISCHGRGQESNSPTNHRYKIAVCDWMILKRQKLGAFQLTKDIGADGVEVDMGSLGERESFDNQLERARFLYREETNATELACR